MKMATKSRCCGLTLHESENIGFEKAGSEKLAGWWPTMIASSSELRQYRSRISTEHFTLRVLSLKCFFLILNLKYQLNGESFLILYTDTN